MFKKICKYNFEIKKFLLKTAVITGLAVYYFSNNYLFGSNVTTTNNINSHKAEPLDQKTMERYVIPFHNALKNKDIKTFRQMVMNEEFYNYDFWITSDKGEYNIIETAVYLAAQDNTNDKFKFLNILWNRGMPKDKNSEDHDTNNILTELIHIYRFSDSPIHGKKSTIYSFLSSVTDTHDFKNFAKNSFKNENQSLINILLETGYVNEENYLEDDKYFAMFKLLVKNGANPCLPFKKGDDFTPLSMLTDSIINIGNEISDLKEFPNPFETNEEICSLKKRKDSRLNLFNRIRNLYIPGNTIII